jgi:hypothetical protein
MKALSIKQPWAWLICAGYKDVENRSWRINREPAPGRHSISYKLRLPNRVYVHAGKVVDWQATMAIDAGELPWLTHDAMDGLRSGHFALGVLIGEVDINDCVTESASPWFEGRYGFTLANPVLYDKPIPYKGSLGFFDVAFSPTEKQDGK